MRYHVPVAGSDAGASSEDTPDEATVQQLLVRGASRADAVAALQHAKGDTKAAVLFWADCLAGGTTAAAHMSRIRHGSVYS